MKTNFFSIPTPCSEDWNKMSPTERGAFCASCKKEVIDCTSLGGEEITSMTQRADAPCIRILPNQIEEINFKIWFNSLSLIKRLRYTFVLALFFVFGLSVHAQESDAIQPQQVSIDSKDELSRNDLLSEYEPDTLPDFYKLISATSWPINDIITGPVGGMPIWEPIGGVPYWEPLITEIDVPDFGDLAIYLTVDSTMLISNEHIDSTSNLSSVLIGATSISFEINEGELLLRTEAKEQENIKLKVYSTTDDTELIHFEPIQIPKGKHQVILPLTGYENGTYIVMLENKEGRESVELIY